jgi:N-acetyltransferase
MMFIPILWNCLAGRRRAVLSDPWVEQPTLGGNHVLLRPLTRADGPAMVEAASDGKLWELFYTGIPSADDIDGYLDAIFKDTGYGRTMPFAVIDKRDGRLVGNTRLLRLNPESRRVEIGGTWYAQSVQRSAVNSECKLLLLTYAFELMDCVCVEIRTDAFNLPSQRAIERLGAKQDGILRAHGFMRGRLRDVAVYSILATEWEGVKRNLEMRLARG